MLTVHHLQVSQSERIVWLCEELNLKYKLQLHQRDPIYSPQSIKDLHPLGTAPIIQDDDDNNGNALTLGESAACADWIIHKHADGRLALSPSHKDYASYLFWFHFSNGSLQPTISRIMMLQFAGVDVGSNKVAHGLTSKLSQELRYVDERLAKNTWLAGDEFTAADIMTVFTLTTMRSFYPVDLSPYKNILEYLKRCTQREAYKRARRQADPDMAEMIDGPPPQNFFKGKL